MKKVYDRTVLIKLSNSKVWQETSWFHHYHYIDEEPENRYYYKKAETFSQACEYTKYIYNANVITTLFTKKPMIEMNIGDSRVTYTEKNFKPFEIKIVYKEVNYLSMSDLSSMLTADEFCEYLKDRNILFQKNFLEK